MNLTNPNILPELPAPEQIESKWKTANPLSLGVEGICKLTTKEVNSFLNYYLEALGYNPVNGKAKKKSTGNAWIYAAGEIPVLLVAHMDTIHDQQVKTITRNVDQGRISSPQGIGGDDRCGIYAITQIIKELKCHVLFTDGEERGGQGAHAFVASDCFDKVKNAGIKYMIELDRKGSHDAVFYTCDNKDFTDFVTDATGFKEQFGSFTDICVLMPELGIAGVNLSCGYYNAHTTMEYILLDELDASIAAAKSLIKTECDKPFKYIRKTYSNYSNTYGSKGSTYYGGSSYYGNDSYYGRGCSQTSMFEEDEDAYWDQYFKDKYGTTKTKEKPNKYNVSAANIAKDYDLYLDILIIDDDTGDEITLSASGNTKAECWANLFLENPDICFNQITDYSFI